MREGSSSEVKYKVQSGGRQIRTNYDDLKANRTYYNKQTRSYNNQQRESAFKGFIAIVLFVFFAFSMSVIQPPANSTFVDTPEETTAYIQSISSDAGGIAEGSIAVVLGIAKPIIDSIQAVTQILGTLISNVAALIEWFYAPISDYDIRDLEDPTIVCSTYEDLALIEQVNLQSRRIWHNLLNEPDLTVQEYYIYTLQVRYGVEAYNEVCSS